MLIRLSLCTPGQRLFMLRGLPRPLVRALKEEWGWQAHGAQKEPKAAPNGEPRRVWAIVAARGSGKTRAGAEWVWARAREEGRARVALVAATIDEVVVRHHVSELHFGQASMAALRRDALRIAALPLEK